ncbi:MAG TPA: hypothetical protein PLU83_01945 [Phycicoccus sp.]|nr:hypothetical protein [Phycicoccus sp.]
MSVQYVDGQDWEGCLWVEEPTDWDGLISAIPREYPGEAAWLAFATKWLAARADLGEGATVRQLVELRLDMCVVASLTRSFHYAADGEDPDHWEWCDWNYAADQIGGEIEAGRILEKYGIQHDPAFAAMAETMTEALKAYVAGFRRFTLGDMANELGVDELFSSLWASRSKSSRFPVAGNSEVLLRDRTAEIDRAFKWFDAQLDHMMPIPPETPESRADAGGLLAAQESGTALLEVGKPYGLETVPAREGVQVRFTPAFSELIVKYAEPSAKEIRDFQGRAEFAIAVISQEVLVFGARFGENWIDAPYEAWRQPEGGRGWPHGDPEDPIWLRTILVNSSTGLIVTMRMDELSADLSTVVRVAIFKQLEKSRDDEAAHEAFTRFNSHYRSPVQWVEEVAHARSASDGPAYLDVPITYYH